MLNLAGAVKTAGYLDGLGCQSHGLESTLGADVTTRLNTLGEDLGVPIYISEFDLNVADDTRRKEKMQELFTAMYTNSHVAGITLSGHVDSRHDDRGGTEGAAHLMKDDGTPRPAMQWLIDTYLNNLTFGK